MRSPIGALLAVAIAAGGCGEGQDQAGADRTVQVTVGEGREAGPGGERGGDGGATARSAARELPGDCPNETAAPEPGNLAQVERATFCLLNAIRRDNGLGALSRDGALAQGATAHSLSMDRENYFAHVSPGGKALRDWVRGTGYIPERGGWRLGENIGWAPKGAASAARLVAGWMESPSHRENILAGDFEDIGIAVVHGVPTSGARPGAIYTTIFGTQSNPPR